jgi:hypothetical protein
MMRAFLVLIFGLLLCGQLTNSEPYTGQTDSVGQNTQSQSVCSAISDGKKTDGREITVAATVIVGDHATLLEGRECGKGIYLVHEWGQTGNLWKVLDDALAGQSGGLDRRVLKVKVRGIYHDAALRRDGSRVRELDITEVLDVKLEDPPIPTAQRTHL